MVYKMILTNWNLMDLIDIVLLIKAIFYKIIEIKDINSNL